MKSTFNRLGDYIVEIDNRNKDMSVSNLLGVSISKEFMPSVANVIGTDLSNYKIISKNQFACSLMQVSRDGGIAVSLYKEDKPAIMSPAYHLFKIVSNELIPEYLEMIMISSEFDRAAVFYAIGGVRGTLTWEEFCDMRIPVPSIEEQRKIVHDYKVITDRIELLKKMSENLEKQASSIYNKMLESINDERTESVYSLFSVSYGSPFSSDFFNTEQRGYQLIRIRDLKYSFSDVYTDEKILGMQMINKGDLLVGMDGEFHPYFWCGEKAVLNQRVCKISPTNNVSPMHIYLFLKPILQEIERTQGGTTVIHIGKKDFDVMKCPRFTNKEIEKFASNLNPYFKMIININAEILALDIIKKALLSRISEEVA